MALKFPTQLFLNFELMASLNIPFLIQFGEKISDSNNSKSEITIFPKNKNFKTANIFIKFLSPKA